MIRNLKVLGLAVVAVLALSAVVASAAMALTPKVEVGTGDGNLTGTQTELGVFTVSGGRTVSCKIATLSGALATTSAEVSGVGSKFEECTSTLAGVTLPATVTVNGCTLTFHVGATVTSPPADTYEATADLVCAAGVGIEVHVYPAGTTPAQHPTTTPLCQYKIGSQNNLGKITALNTTTASPKDIDATLAITGISYTRTIGTIPNCGAASGTTATLSGKATVTGKTTAGVATDVQIVEV